MRAGGQLARIDLHAPRKREPTAIHGLGARQDDPEKGSDEPERQRDDLRSNEAHADTSLPCRRRRSEKATVTPTNALRTAVTRKRVLDSGPVARKT